jgi:hypothetical protein
MQLSCRVDGWFGGDGALVYEYVLYEYCVFGGLHGKANSGS